MNTNSKPTTEAEASETSPQPLSPPLVATATAPDTGTPVGRGIIGAVALYGVLVGWHLSTGGDENGAFLLALFLAVWAIVAVLASKAGVRSSITGVGGGFILGLLAIIPFAPSKHPPVSEKAEPSKKRSANEYATQAPTAALSKMDKEPAHYRKEPFEVALSVTTKMEGGRLIVEGKTNLPDSTLIMINITGTPAGEDIVLGCEKRKVVVHGGTFRAGPYAYFGPGNQNGHVLPAGNYRLHATVPFEGAQPPAVQTVFGHLGANLTGPMVAARAGFGRIAELDRQITVSGDDSQRALEQLKTSIRDARVTGEMVFTGDAAERVGGCIVQQFPQLLAGLHNGTISPEMARKCVFRGLGQGGIDRQGRRLADVTLYKIYEGEFAVKNSNEGDDYNDGDHHGAPGTFVIVDPTPFPGGLRFVEMAPFTTRRGFVKMVPVFAIEKPNQGK